MKQIINGKMYNTETACEIMTNDFFDEWKSSAHICETLYKKENGEFFLCRDMFGDGDAIDEYYWVLKHRMEPLTEERAKMWVEKYGEVETYIALFGEPEE